MNVYEAIAARRTIRDFDGREIDRATLMRVLDAGMRAPSHDHLREWHFVLVEDIELRRALVHSFLRERRRDELLKMLDRWGMIVESQREMYLDAIPKQGSMLLEAGALIIPCFRQEASLLGEKGSLHELNAFASIWMVLENVLVAAASESVLGVTKIISSPEEQDHIRGTLGIPAKYEIPCYLALGYPSPGVYSPGQVAIDLTKQIHINVWRG